MRGAVGVGGGVSAATVSAAAVSAPGAGADVGVGDDVLCASTGKPTSNKPTATQPHSTSWDHCGVDEVGLVRVPSRCKPRSVMSAGLGQLDFQELQKAWVGVSIGGQIVEQKRRINRRQIGFHQFLLNGLNENQAQDQTDQG